MAIGIEGDYPVASVHTVMTYNIRNGHPDSGHQWSERARSVGKVIEDESPDVLATQEVLHPQLLDLTDLLPKYGYAGLSRLGNSEDEYCPIWWRRECFELADSGQWWLSDTPMVAASNTWDSLLPRIATWALLRRRGDGKEFAAISTHFDHEPSKHGDEVRRRSAELITGLATTLNVPALIMGDLNTTAGSAAISHFATAGYIAAGANTGGRPLPGTFHDYGRIRAGHGQREGSLPSPSSGDPIAGGDGGELEQIDWIFTTADITPLAAHVANTSPLAVQASDHFALVADIAI